MFRVDIIEDRGIMHGVQGQLVMREHRTELGMLIQVNQGRLSATTATENRVALDEELLLFIAGGQDNTIDEDVDEQPVQDLALNVNNVFQADDCDAFDSDVEEAPMAHTMFMANLSSADPVYDEAGPSYDSDILSEVHDDVQPNYVVDSHAIYTSVAKSLTAELATYKEQVELYERRARFELTKREQKIDEQLRIVITDRNIKEENLKKELHSVKLQLSSTINHNKSMALKGKGLDKLYKQDQSLQTVHMLCKPKPYYDEKNKVGFRVGSEITTPGFKQTKECYLTEVIPFFKTLKDHFEGIQKALTKEIKGMKDIFEELEAEVDQNVVHRKHAEIERKNLLIANDNLIADCLSKDVFYITTNSELTVSRFTEMHDAHTVVQARCLELEVDLSKLRDKIQTDDHNELVNQFSNLEVNHLNPAPLKSSKPKESFGITTSTPRETP
ncbi:hypothetical protein Tco_0766511 [Tanacetum coccineum]